jgi:hypothetical protein
MKCLAARVNLNTRFTLQRSFSVVKEALTLN